MDTIESSGWLSYGCLFHILENFNSPLTLLRLLLLVQFLLLESHPQYLYKIIKASFSHKILGSSSLGHLFFAHRQGSAKITSAYIIRLYCRSMRTVSLSKVYSRFKSWSDIHYKSTGICEMRYMSIEVCLNQIRPLQAQLNYNIILYQSEPAAPHL